MTDKGIAHIGIGTGRGDDKALEAVKQAVASPLLETTIAGASNVIVNVSGDITLMDALMQLIMYRSLQVKVQVSSSVLCMMIQSLMNVQSQLLLQAYIM